MSNQDPNADRNLLFGILAVQMDFIRRDELIASMNAWVLDKTTPLEEILVFQGALAEDEKALLSALVQKHLDNHENDAEKSGLRTGTLFRWATFLRDAVCPRRQLERGNCSVLQEIDRTSPRS
jgi:hypothetical protein